MEDDNLLLARRLALTLGPPAPWPPSCRQVRTSPVKPAALPFPAPRARLGAAGGGGCGSPAGLQYPRLARKIPVKVIRFPRFAAGRASLA
jgi:hypothetical protein